MAESEAEPTALPPFATPTLARLYLSQGRFDKACAILSVLGDNGAETREVQAAVRVEAQARADRLTSILQRVQERRR